jgi:nucleotide-binding universal stress UspA family protein
MRKIVVPVSFAAGSRTAALYAADLSAVLGAGLELVHVVVESGGFSKWPVPAYVFDELRDSGYVLLQDLAAELSGRSKVSVGTTLEIGEVVDKVKEVCGRVHPFLVVVGAGEKGVDAGQTVRAMQRLPYPLLVVPADAVFHGVQRIAVACDQEDIYSGVAAVLPFLKELNGLLRAKLDVVHVVVSGQSLGAPAREYDGWKKVLAEFGDQLHIVREQSVVPGVQYFLEKHPVDWLLVLPKRHTLLEFHKSRAKDIVMRSPVPVMSVHE